MYIPLVGRLSVGEWPMVIFSFVAIWVEFVSSIITKLIIPEFAIQRFTHLLGLVNKFMFGSDDFGPHDSVRNRVRSADDIHEMCAVFGYAVEDHIVATRDGYLLTLHRIAPLNEGAPVVYLHHGLLMCSDIWCTKLENDENLPFKLHELGFDVWMGNNRGNKYSSKHLHLKPSSLEFWDFSIDEFAIYDIPDSIDHILQLTKTEHLAYIGFSQGSAQAFAALSINERLNQQVTQFIAIAPAMTPHGLNNNMVDSLMKASPNIMYLIFGKRSLLSTTNFWARTMYPPLFAKVIDCSIRFLFDWRSENITHEQKVASYSKLYSSTSVKSVVHWFQIIRNANFQMFDEVDTSLTNFISKSFKPLNFPTRTNIRTNVTLIFGESDSLVDINEMLSCLPQGKGQVKAIGVEGYEHVDLIWGRDVGEKVFKHVVDVLGSNEKVNGRV